MKTLLLALLLALPAGAKEITAEFKNAYNGNVWAFSHGVFDPWDCVWEARTVDGRIMQRERGMTTQLTLDDEWRVIELLVVYGEQKHSIVLIRARLVNNKPVFQVLKGGKS